MLFSLIINSVLPRGLAGVTGEGVVELRLALVADALGDLLGGELGRQQKLCGVVDALLRDIIREIFAAMLLEHTGKIC